MAEEKKAAPSAGGSDENKLLAALCYIIGVLVPLFVIFTDKKNDRFLAFHAYQSLLLTVVYVVVFVGFGLLTTMAAFATGGVGSMLGCLAFPLWAAAVVIVLYVAYKAYQGERYMLPVVGEMAAKYAK
jgi:uncharacterized membrane protein